MIKSYFFFKFQFLAGSLFIINLKGIPDRVNLTMIRCNAITRNCIYGGKVVKDQNQKDLRRFLILLRPITELKKKKLHSFLP